MKQSKKFYLSVEGETEKWYFNHLQRLINGSSEARFKAVLSTRKNNSPKKHLKSLALSNYNNAIAFHICDYESNNEEHVRNFKEVLNELHEINKGSGNLKKIKGYSLGYSNFTFDLWIALHKKQCMACKLHRDHYLEFINSAYDRSFRNLDEYKREHNFKSILSCIDLNDVIFAIKNAEQIRYNKCDNGEKIVEYKKFKYYRDNPDLTINDVVKKILLDCKYTVEGFK